MSTRAAPIPIGLVLAVTLGLLGVTGAHRLGAQQRGHTVGVGTHFHGYDFDQGLGAGVANLFMVPVAYHMPVTDRLQADFYASWARGRVERGGTTYRLDGITDTQVRASYQATPWALATLSVNLPTAEASHDANEAVVASILATDLLGFREANWGTGFSVTPGVATATSVGEWGLGLGASYRAAGGFEPEAGQPLTYEPGDEIRIRAGVDRNVGESGTLTAGLTFQNFDTDEFGGRNLFEAGNRVRFDATLALRAGSSTWTVFGSNTWREEGDVTLQIVNQQGSPVGDTLVHTQSQNLARVGVAGSIPVGATYRIRPTVDLQVQTRENVDGSAWILGAGADLPLRVVGLADLFPRARFLVGRLTGAGGESVGVWGGELGLTVRWSP